MTYPKSTMRDTIIYLVKTLPGGVDGLASDDQGGTVVAATFDAEEASKKKGLDTRLVIAKEVIGADEINELISRLNVVELLLLKTYFANTKSPTFRGQYPGETEFTPR